ncbi:protein ecdysoneless homolog isoform X2 [Pieris brassicae]|uniref:protein ecdysoneless homolog isoform X2 n=1 Tax=Pieris brassicae TaxID=7116 RepID=UPI001E660E2A|nr:protein ecdysoneless homolog isoform X2 [Pieris brassicae]
MKRLFVIGLCLAVVLAAPTPDDDDHHDLDDNRPQQPRAQRRLQQHHQIDDDDDDDDLQQHHRRWLQNHQHQIDNDDDDDDDQRRQQQQQIRRRLQELSLKFIDDRDDDNRLRADVNRHNLRPDDDRNDEQLRNSNLDVLAKELDNLAAKYNGRGVLKVGYNPPLVRNVIKKFKEFNESMIDNQLKHYVLQSPGARAHNLGSIDFKYFTPSEVASRVHHHKDLVPVPSIKANNGYVLLRGLDRQDLRARDDDDDDDDDQL